MPRRRSAPTSLPPAESISATSTARLPPSSIPPFRTPAERRAVSAIARIIRLRRRRGRCRTALAGLLLTAGTTAAAIPPLDELRRDRRLADDLYTATTSDAATFEKALSNPALRTELEHTLNRNLTDDTLKAMATHARAEADYWSAYRVGVDKMIGAEYPGAENRRAPGRAAPPVPGV